MNSRREIANWVQQLPIPEERRQVVLAELEDHVFETMAELEAGGMPTAEAETRACARLGSPASLRARLVPVEAAYSMDRWDGAGYGFRVAVASALAIAAAAAIDHALWNTVMASRYFEVTTLFGLIGYDLGLFLASVGPPLLVYGRYLRSTGLGARISVAPPQAFVSLVVTFVVVEAILASFDDRHVVPLILHLCWFEWVALRRLFRRAPTRLAGGILR